MAKPINYICGHSRPRYFCNRCGNYVSRAAFTDDNNSYCYKCIDERDWPKNSIYIHTYVDGIEIEDLNPKDVRTTAQSYHTKYPEITANILAELALFTKLKI